MRRLSPLVVALILVLSACGSTSEERGITGAGLGAAGGAIIGAVTGLTVLQAALIGTGVGGLTGLLTDQDDLNLGEPFWNGWFEGSRRQTASSAAPAHSPLVAETQGNLARLGYDPGPADGLFGPRTRTALQEYQQDHGLASNGLLTEDVASHVAEQARDVTY